MTYWQGRFYYRLEVINRIFSFKIIFWSLSRSYRMQAVNYFAPLYCAHINLQLSQFPYKPSNFTPFSPLTRFLSELFVHDTIKIITYHHFGNYQRSDGSRRYLALLKVLSCLKTNMLLLFLFEGTRGGAF